MNNISNSFRSTKDTYFQLVSEDGSLDWINKKLDITDLASIVIFRDFKASLIGPSILKKVHAFDCGTVTIGRISEFAQLIDKEIESVKLLNPITVGPKFTTAGEEWMIEDECDYTAVVKFKELDFLVGYISKTASGAHSSSTYNIMVLKRENLNALIRFFQKIEASMKSISMTRMETGEEHQVEPLSWEALILDDITKSDICDRFDSFLNDKAWYIEKGLPYRLGFLFHGDPGNGKSSVIRAMMTQARVPTFSMKQMAGNKSEETFESMFYDASKHELSMILLEDIDRVFSTRKSEKDSDRSTVNFSTFLNCLDGIGNYSGLIIVATANNPKNLDPSILERPGRFDKVIAFPNPTHELKIAYFAKKCPEFSKEQLDNISTLVGNSSFAQLQEVYISAHMLAKREGRKQANIEDFKTAASKLHKGIKTSTSHVGF